MSIKVIFIDWDKTLSTSRFWRHWATAKPQYYELIQKHLFGSNSDTSQAWMRGQLSAEQVTRRLATITGMDGGLLLRELERSCQNMQFIDQSVQETIMKLRSNGVKVVIATDNMDTFPRWTVPALNLSELVDHILDSHTLGVLKRDMNPDGSSMFFQPYLSGQKIKPSEAVLFDDNAPYVENFGIKYIQVSESRPLASELATYLS